MDTSASDKLALALDVDNLDTASALAQTLAGYFRVAKIGLELYTTAGPDAVKAVAGLGYDIFCDLKLHDIPNTVRPRRRRRRQTRSVLSHGACLRRRRDARSRRRRTRRGVLTVPLGCWQ